jgi:hypothetical protein
MCVAVLVDDEKCKKGHPNDGGRGVPEQGGVYLVQLLCVYIPVQDRLVL